MKALKLYSLLLALQMTNISSPARAGDIEDFLRAARNQFAPAAVNNPAQIKTNISTPELTRYIKTNYQPLNWASLLQGDDRVIYLGETHFDTAIMKELANHAGELREAGITHLGLEFGEEYKDLFTRYSTEGTPEMEGKVHAAILAWINSMFSPEFYFQALKKAKEAGLILTPVDMSDKDERELLDLCKKQNRPDCSSPANKDFADARDFKMASNLNQILNESQSKVLMLVGPIHIETEKLHFYRKGPFKKFAFLYNKGNMMADYLAHLDKNLDTYSLSKQDIAFCRAIDADAALANQRIFIPTDRAQTGFDGLIALPQDCAAATGN